MSTVSLLAVRLMLPDEFGLVTLLKTEGVEEVNRGLDPLFIFELGVPKENMPVVDGADDTVVLGITKESPAFELLLLTASPDLCGWTTEVVAPDTTACTLQMKTKIN
ncbi:hypothetical protein TB1_039407 [Malus domestica]